MYPKSYFGRWPQVVDFPGYIITKSYATQWRGQTYSYDNNNANDDEKDQVAKAFQVMYGFDDKDLEEIKLLLEGKHTIEIDGVSVPLIQHLKFRIGRPDIGIAKAPVSQSMSNSNQV